MPRRLRKAVAQGEAAGYQAEQAAYEARKLVAKGAILVNEAIDLLDKLEDEGIELSLEIFGKDIPLKLKIKSATNKT